MFKRTYISFYLIGLVLSFTFGTASAQRTRAKNKKKQNTEQSAAGILRQAEYFFVEGEKYFLLGDYTKAVAEFQKSLELDPKNDVVYFKLAEIYHRTDQLENAEEAIVKALSAETKNKFYYLLAVDIYTAAGKRSEVADIYISLMKNIPDSDQYLISLAAVYLFQDKLDKALETYEKIENIYGINEQTTFQKQKIYLKQNNVEKAIEEGKKLIEAYPKMPKYVILLGEILSSNSRTTEAVLLLQDLTKHNPEVSEARLVLADIFLKERDYDHFSSELELAFKDPELNINAKINTLMKYMAYLPNVQLQSVIPGLVEVLTTTHPDDPNSHLLSGDIYATFLEQNLVDEERIDAVRKKAIESYTIYLQEDPSKFAVWQNLLNLELQTENQDSLAIHADRALELFPNQAWLYLVNGVAFLQQGNDAQAVRMFEMGKKRSANNIGLTVLFNAYLGDTYQGLGEHVKSDAAYEAALKLDPNNYIVLNNYSYYLSLRQEKLDQAKKMATRLIRNNPDNDTYLDTYAWVHYALGNYEEAKRVLEKVVVGDEPHAEYFNHYGDVLYQLGFRNEAVIQWKKARELDNNLENIDQKIAERKVIQ